jgi:uncharacterized protein YndB with AHSA1/START domain
MAARRLSEGVIMSDIRHRIGINAPRAQVHHALATTAGIASWWAGEARGDVVEGGKLLLYFGSPEPRLVFAVIEIRADRIDWRCLEGPDEWVDTTITFELDHRDGETAVLFTHADWRETVPFQAHCSTKWAYFLLGLKSLLEGGEATPFPRDLHISSWG